MSAPYETVVQPVAKAGATALLTFGKEITAIVATLGKDVPLAGTVCATFLAFEELVETAKSNKEDLDTLLELCDAVVKTTMRERCSEYSAGLEEALLTLEKHLAAAKDVARLCNGRVKQFIMGRQIAKDIAAVRQNVVDFSATINVALSHGLHVSFIALSSLLTFGSRTQEMTAPSAREQCDSVAFSSSAGSIATLVLPLEVATRCVSYRHACFVLCNFALHENRRVVCEALRD